MDAVRAASDGLRVTTERADIEEVLSSYLDAPETVIIRSDQTLVSFSELQRVVVPEFRGIRAQEVRARVRHIYPLGPQAAAESQVGTWTTTDTAGVVVPKEFALTRTWTHQNGRWQIVHSYMVVRPVRP